MQEEWTRREFIRNAAIGVAGLALAAQGLDLALPQAAQAAKAATVVDVRDSAWRKGSNVDAEAIKKMINQGVMRLSGKQTVKDAWSAFVGKNEKVGIKVNGLSRDHTRAIASIVDAIVEGVGSVGVPKTNVFVAEARGPEGTSKPDTSRGPEVSFGSSTTRLTRFVTDQIDVLINVPDLKTHGSAGVTAAMKNLSHSHSIMTDPGRFHGNRCSPYIAEINAMKPINTKRRLSICNGLVSVYEGGPGTGNPKFHWPHNGFLFSTDPVAMDRVCLELINQHRKAKGLGKILHNGRDPEYISVAHELGLGESDLGRIDWVKV